MKEQVRKIFLGDFGEYLLTFFLRSKYGIEVALVKSEGIDLLCIDNEGRLLPKRKLVAISVKTRERKKNINESVNQKWEALEEASKKWNAEPYFAYVRIAPIYGKIDIFLLPLDKAKKYSSKNFNVNKAEKDKDNCVFKLSSDSYMPVEGWRQHKIFGFPATLFNSFLY